MRKKGGQFFCTELNFSKLGKKTNQNKIIALISIERIETYSKLSPYSLSKLQLYLSFSLKPWHYTEYRYILAIFLFILALYILACQSFSKNVSL